MNRRYDFDWLRVFGAVMVVVAHCAGLFSSWAPAFGSIQRSKLISELLWNLNLWLMPLFMLLAGASVWYTLRKRSNGQYLRERLLHLGLPFVLLTVSFGMPMAYYSKSSTGQFSGSLVDFYLHFFRLFPGNTFHLWFLAYLLIFALLTLPLFRFLQGAVGRQLIDRLACACQRPGGIYLFALPLVVVQLALSGLSPVPPLTAPPNDWTRFVLLLLVFIFGYVLVADARFQEAITRQWRPALVVAATTSAILAVIAWPDDFDVARGAPLNYSWQYAAFWAVFALSTWSWLVTWLGFGQRFLNVNHPLLKRAAAASYPLYLLHPLFMLPALSLAAYWQADALVAFAGVTTIVLVGTLMFTALLKRWRVTRFLLGLKTEPADSHSLLSRRESDATGLRCHC